MSSLEDTEKKPKRIKTPHPEIVQYTSNEVYYYRNKGVEKSLRTTDWVKALKRLDIEKQKGHGSVDASKLRITDVHPDYVKFRKQQRDGRLQSRRKIRNSTFLEIVNVFRNHLLPYFGPKRLTKVDEDMWDQYCYESSVGDLSNHRKVFTSFLKWCRRKKYIRFIPEFDIPPIKRRKRRLLTEREIKAILINSKGSLHLFLSIALFMGMRRGEVISLRWEHIHFADKFLVVPDTVSKTNQERIVTINSYCLELLRIRRQEDSRTPWVFPNKKSNQRMASPSGLKTAWTTCKKHSDIEGRLTWNDLRATCEKYAHLSTKFTDTQREKFYGSSSDVQKKTYAHSFLADELRGLEDAVQVGGLSELLLVKLSEAGESLGNRK
jgi:integrase